MWRWPSQAQGRNIVNPGQKVDRMTPAEIKAHYADIPKSCMGTAMTTEIEARIAQLDRTIWDTKQYLAKLRAQRVDLQLLLVSKTPSAALKASCDEAMADMVEAGMRAFYDAVDSELWDYGSLTPELLTKIFLAMEAVRPKAEQKKGDSS
jgi:hypothetical protein